MQLTCTCTHAKINHDGGKNWNALRVHQCSITGCTCTKYHHDKSSKKMILKVQIDLAKTMVVVAVGVFGLLAFLASVVGLAVEDAKADLSTKLETLLPQLEKINATNANLIDSDFALITDTIGLLYFAVGFFALLLFWLLYLEPKYVQEIEKLTSGIN